MASKLFNSLLGASGVPLLFDGMDMMHVGIWDLKLRRSDYAGPAVRVRRQSDNAEIDIDFLPNGSVDMATYEAYGTGSEKVITVYDQSGNGFDFTQSTLANAPYLATSSYNGNSCIKFSDGIRMRVTDFTDWNGLADCHFIMAQRQTVLTTGYPLIGGSGGRIVNWTAGASDNVYWGESGSNRSQYTKKNRGGQLVRYTFDGGAATNALKARMFVNQIELTAGVVGNHATTFPNETHLDWNGTPLNGGAGMTSEYFGFYYIGQNLTSEKLLAIENRLKADQLTFTSSQLLCIGDSLTANSSNGGSGSANSYPNLLNDALEIYTGATWIPSNLGAAAERLAVEITNRFASQVLESRDECKANDVVVLWGGTNDLAGDMTGGSTIVNATLAAAVSLCTSAAVDGFDVYFPNMLPREDVDNVNPTFEADRASFNSQLANELAGVATVVDVAAIANLSEPTNTTYFLGDKVHLTDAGNALIANAVAAAIEANL